MKKRLIIILLTIIIVGMGLPGAAPGSSPDDIRFEPRRTDQNVRLELRGTGLLRYMAFVKVYAGALYLPADVPSEQALSDVPKRLEVEYLRAFKGPDVGRATWAAIRKNVGDRLFEQLRPQIELHNSLYVDVAPGDRYALTYVPGKGTSLELNGRTLGTIEGAHFAAALFAIWLGPAPINTAFKAELLGES